MLTGFADHRTAVDAADEVNIFRFRANPCSAVLLVRRGLAAKGWRGARAGAEQPRGVRIEDL